MSTVERDAARAHWYANAWYFLYRVGFTLGLRRVRRRALARSVYWAAMERLLRGLH